MISLILNNSHSLSLVQVTGGGVSFIQDCSINILVSNRSLMLWPCPPRKLPPRGRSWQKGFLLFLSKHTLCILQSLHPLVCLFCFLTFLCSLCILLCCVLFCFLTAAHGWSSRHTFRLTLVNFLTTYSYFLFKHFMMFLCTVKPCFFLVCPIQ